MPNAVHDPAAPPVKSLALESKGGNSKLIEVFGSMSATFTRKFTQIFRRLLTALVPVFLLTGFSAAQFTPIVNNITSLCSPYSKTQPDCGYFPVFGPTGDPAVPLSESTAVQFTPKVGAKATEARVTVVQNAPGPGYPSTGSLTAAIFSDADGLPGTQIGKASATFSAPYCCNAATLTASFPEPVSLDAGVPYWLVVEAGAASTYVAWVVDGSEAVPVAQTLTSPSAQECGWCSYGSSALQFAVDSGTKPSPLTVVDPYLLTIPANDSLSVNAVVTAAAAGKATAKGIVADGTSAAIAVFKTASSSDVTFSATNGVTFAAYNPDFLTAVSSSSPTLVVSPKLIGSAYYALALVVSGTAPDAEHGADTVITAATTINKLKSTDTFSMLTLPTPVVLIHGLWGHLASLASTESYLKATAGFKSHPSLVTPICYSIYLGFDAEADTIPGHGTGCEVTSAQALSKYFSTTLYKQLDTDHYVGGRVDAVAHSMGGLAVRHFRAIAGYKSVRNRNLGAFRKVITLDTPEEGSALATYLDDTAYKRTLMDSNVFSAPYLLWTNVCPSGASTTVETCFYKNGFPLAYKGAALSTGAVASLIPGGRSIANAPSPDLFNTDGKWYAIASDFPDSDHPAALLRDVLNAFIAATYPSGQTPPNLSGLLGTNSNDVIVTVPSQTSTAVPAQTKQFKDLQHTPAPTEALLLPGFGSDSNNSVSDSAAVNGQVAYWLGLQTTAVPASQPAQEENLQPEEAGSSSLSAEAKASFAAPARLSVAAPDQSVGLGQPVRMHLTVSGADVARISVSERDIATGRELTNQSGEASVGSGMAKIDSKDDGTVTIEVTPLQLGRVSLRIGVLFADGGLAQKEFEINIVPSARGLRRFDLNRGFQALALVLEGDEEDRQAYLVPEVQYDALRYPVYLDSSEQLNLTVDQPEDDPVISVNPNGLIHALRPGTAVVTGDFDGMKDSIQVDVYTREGAPAGYRRADE
jgi:hypothetical protein